MRGSYLYDYYILYDNLSYYKVNGVIMKENSLRVVIFKKLIRLNFKRVKIILKIFKNFMLPGEKMEYKLHWLFFWHGSTIPDRYDESFKDVKEMIEKCITAEQLIKERNK